MLKKQFDSAIALNEELFGEHAFRKSLAKGTKASLSPINISLIEVCVVHFSELGSLTERQKKNIRAGIIELLNYENFANAITYSTNS